MPRLRIPAAALAAGAAARMCLSVCLSVPGAPAGQTQPCQPQPPAQLLQEPLLSQQEDLSAKSSREMPVGTAPRLARSSGQAAERLD